MNQAAVTRLLDDIVPAFERGDPAVASKKAEKDNVRLILTQYQALGREDLAGLLAGLAEDVELEVLGPKEVPFVGRWRGRQAVMEATRRNFALFEDQRPEVLTLVGQGDTVVLILRERGTYRPTGRPYDVHFVHVFTLADGRVTHIREIFDSGPILEAMRPAG
jgi:ketosteroid isomerase-like protein